MSVSAIGLDVHRDFCEIAELQLGKTSEELNARAEKLAAKFDRYADDRPPVRFTDTSRSTTAGPTPRRGRGCPSGPA